MLACLLACFACFESCLQKHFFALRAQNAILFFALRSERREARVLRTRVLRPSAERRERSERREAAVLRTRVLRPSAERREAQGLRTRVVRPSAERHERRAGLEY